MKFRPRLSYTYALAGLFFWGILLLETDIQFLDFKS
jgi:hypothetical protein